MSGPNVLQPAGPAASVLATAGWIMIVLLSVATVIFGVLLVLAATRKRGTLAEHADVHLAGGGKWILYGGFVLPAIIFGGLFVYAMKLMGSTPAAGDPTLPVIRITGHQWWWDVEYVFPDSTQRFRTANELHIPIGRTVEVTTHTADVIHSFWAPQLNGKMDLIPGETGSVRLRADRPGSYLGVCAEYCGLQHAHMDFLVIAEPREMFDAWVASQRSVAAVPSDSVSQRGAAAFNSHACVQCHTIRGTPAAGLLGPDLTHLASRRTIAAGALPNQRGALQGWVVNAQSLKPGVAMPSFHDLDGATLNAIVSYLMTLR